MTIAPRATQAAACHWPIVAAILGVPLVALALTPLRGHIDNTNVALIMVVVVVAVSLSAHRVAAAVAALAAAFWFDFFFTVPFNSAVIASGEDALTATLLLVVGLTVGELSVWALHRRDEAERGRADLRRIHHAAELMSQGDAVDRLVRAVSMELSDLLSLRECRFDPGPPDPLLSHVEHDGSVHWGEIVWSTETFGLPISGVTLEAQGNGVAAGSFTMVPSSGMAIDTQRLVVAVALADQVGAALAVPPRA
jgi:K+-sensing histidine kinase KdpD